MPRIQVNADVQAAGGFPLWADGVYTLRITETEATTASTGKAQLRVRLEAVSAINDEGGRPLANPGTLLDFVTIDPIQTKTGGTVSFLRGLWEAAGLSWGADIDTDDLIGKEVSAKVAIEKFVKKDGTETERNRVKRYMKPS